MDWKTFEASMKEYPKWFRYLYFFLLVALCHGCNSIVLSHSEGTTSDLVDENLTPTTDINASPTLNFTKDF